MAQKLATIANGVDVSRLAETIEAVKAEPELAKFQFRLQNRWIHSGENRSKVDEFTAGGNETRHKTSFTLIADEPEMLLGADNGANPVEHLLHALASCVTTSTVYHAAARGIAVEEVESTLEGELDLRGFLGLDAAIRNGYQGIRMKLFIKGIEDINRWLEKDYWPNGKGGRREDAEWIVGQEKGIDCREGALWYGGGRTVRLGKGF